MTYADLVRLYFQQSDAIQSYWTLYVVVIGGLVAVAAMRPKPDIFAGILATILYCSFAYKNLGAIRDCTVTRQAVLATLSTHDGPSGTGVADETFQRTILPTLNPPAYESSRSFHIACDGLTVILLWGLQWRRWRASRDATDAVPVRVA